MRFTLGLAALVLAPVAFAQNALQRVADDIFQVRYASNLNIGDSVINMTNTGANTGANTTPIPAIETLGPQLLGTTRNICANLYTFDPAEELISCCACKITPAK